jgi:hypothetical protein
MSVYSENISVYLKQQKYNIFEKGKLDISSKHRQYSSRYQLFGVKQDEMRWIVTEYQRF